MKWNFKVNVTHFLLILLIGFLILSWRGQRQDAIRWQENFETSQSTFSQYKSESEGVIISTQKSLELTEKELREALLSDSANAELAEHYRKLSGVVTIITEFDIDTLYIPVPELIIPDTTVRFAQEGCFEVELGLQRGLITLNDMYVPNTQKIVYGLRKTSLFRSEYSIDIYNSNKCIDVVGVRSYTVVHKRKAWENPLITVPFGILVGFLLKD